MTSTKQHGFSLIEVMVAVLIVAVGILGVAGMQVVSLQQNRDALLRDQALLAGNDILDRMRANPATEYAPIGFADAPAAGFDCITNSCSRDGMRAFDVAQWKCRINPIDDAGQIYPVCDGFGIIQASLPGGRGSIQLDAGVHEITVRWIHDRDGNTTEIKLRTQVGVI
ncbi:MAG: type IV pilus modification protein PilV [Pseudomonadales bacterium]|nr:type IV pilus modification protein PilV [Pseudomonadales bacterium]